MIISIEIHDNFPDKRIYRHVNKLENESSRFSTFVLLEKMRKKYNISIDDLCFVAGYDKSAFHHYKTGKYVPKEETLKDYFVALKKIVDSRT